MDTSLGAMVLAGGLASSTAQAQAPDVGVELRWSAPEGCPEAARVRARLEEDLDATAGALTVDAEVSVDEDGTFRADVELTGPWGTSRRELDSPTCQTLAEAVVLLAVVSVGSAGNEVLSVPEPEPEPEPTPEPELEPEPEPEPTPVIEQNETDQSEPSPSADATPAEPSVRAVARVEARAGGGVLPGGDFSAAVAAGLSLRRLRLELSGAGWLPRTEVVSADADVRIDLFSGELRGCVPLGLLSWFIALPCVGVELGGMRGRGQGSGLVAGRTSWQSWIAAAVTPAFAIRVSPRIGVWLGGSLVVPLRRPGFVLEGATEEAYRVPALSGRGALGVEFHFAGPTAVSR